jgi:hypothetical protein
MCNDGISPSFSFSDGRKRAADPTSFSGVALHLLSEDGTSTFRVVNDSHRHYTVEPSGGFANRVTSLSIRGEESPGCKKPKSLIITTLYF